MGLVPYGEGLSLQEQALERRRADPSSADQLLLCEHPRVVTQGRSTKPENLLLTPEALAARGIALFEAARGGDVTYHAPGQLVGYPIVDLAAREARDVHVFLRSLEQLLIDVLAEFDLPAARVEGKTGVFMTPGAAGERLPHHEIESVELRGLNRGLGRAKDLRGRGGRAARRNFNAIVWGSDRSRQ